MTLRLLARYTPPGWGDPIPECVNGHNWGYWRKHPNGENDVRSCRRAECSFSEWRTTLPSMGQPPEASDE